MKEQIKESSDNLAELRHRFDEMFPCLNVPPYMQPDLSRVKASGNQRPKSLEISFKPQTIKTSDTRSPKKSTRTPPITPTGRRSPFESTSSFYPKQDESPRETFIRGKSEYYTSDQRILSDTYEAYASTEAASEECYSSDGPTYSRQQAIYSKSSGSRISSAENFYPSNGNRVSFTQRASAIAQESPHSSQPSSPIVDEPRSDDEVPTKSFH